MTEHKCGSAKSCEYGDMCKPKYDIGGCSHYKEKRPQTNEEYIKSLDTKQLAEWLRGVYWHCHEIDCEHCNYPWRCMEKGDIVEWLKQPHTPKE